MRILALLACATLVDVWPRYVPGQRLPGPSPFQGIHLAAGPDTVLALYPARHFLSERAWVEQLYHGRRLVNGFNSFAPPLHAWLDQLERDAPAAVVLQVHREMGAAAVDVHLDEIPEGRRGEVEELLGSLSAAGHSVLCSAGRCLVAFREVLEPQLVTPSRVRGLDFQAGEAVVATSPGRLILRLSGGELPVRIRTSESSRDDVLEFPLVSAERMTARLRSVPPPGAVVETPDAAVLGTVR